MRSMPPTIRLSCTHGGTWLLRPCPPRLVGRLRMEGVCWRLSGSSWPELSVAAAQPGQGDGSMTAPIVLIGIPALLLLVVALPGVRIAKESERGVDGGPVASWPFFQQAEELMSDARL